MIIECINNIAIACIAIHVAFHLILLDHSFEVSSDLFSLLACFLQLLGRHCELGLGFLRGNYA